MLFTIVILACLTPTDCRSYELPRYLDNRLPAAQWSEAQQIVAGWQSMHPNLKVKKFRLEKGRGV